MKNQAFHALLRKRRTPEGKPWTVCHLANVIGSGRSHLTQVLNGQRRGPSTCRKLRRVLTEEEQLALGWAVQRTIPAVFHAEQKGTNNLCKP